MLTIEIWSFGSNQLQTQTWNQRI